MKHNILYINFNIIINLYYAINIKYIYYTYGESIVNIIYICLLL